MHPELPITNYRLPAAERLVSVSRACPGVTAAYFLRQAQGQERFYWADGQAGVSLAAFGVAAEMMAWGEYRFEIIQKKAEALFHEAHLDSDTPLVGPRLFGGFAFRDDFTPDNTWSVFHPAHFILPHFQLTEYGGQSWLTLNSLLPTEEDPVAALPWLEEAWAARYQQLRRAQTAVSQAKQSRQVVAVNYPMPLATWAAKIEEAHGRFQTTPLKKVVLARICETWLDGRADVDAALAYLDEQYGNCYRFLFEPRPYHAFFGATPELLVSVSGEQVKTMGLAGSIRRGATAAEDEALAGQLLNDAKERYEHALVVDAIGRRLGPLTTELQTAATPTIYPLANIQHLYTPIHGRLLRPSGVLPLVELLHPTPALGGSPRDLALAFIRDAEPAPRGWYAGPIGWLDPNLQGAFAVAIRSAVTQEERVWLYAGAGIVADSTPAQEWEETGLKFRPILNAMGIVNGEL
jgi:menaquinone-specific isochorismate synthase